MTKKAVLDEIRMSLQDVAPDFQFSRSGMWWTRREGDLEFRIRVFITRSSGVPELECVVRDYKYREETGEMWPSEAVMFYVDNDAALSEGALLSKKADVPLGERSVDLRKIMSNWDEHGFKDLSPNSMLRQRAADGEQYPMTFAMKYRKWCQELLAR